MWGKHVLNAVQFPDASFQSTSCKAAGNEVDVTGKLSIHGVAADVTVRMSIQADGKTFHGKGVLDTKHSDFGMRPYRALMGALRNDEALQFHIDVKGQAK